MKKLLNFFAILFVLFSTSVLAHHPAEDIVDEDIYAMIDSMVADTPHADLTFEQREDAMDTTITSESMVQLDNMLEDSLMTYVDMLEGDVSVTIDFNDDRSVTMTIMQTL
ncbi:hypothetical protein [Methylomarinum vadi]|uniref:hypothetical protein n=1 Tax=Methylomarinum vadi TaxID=438855 RepID=UPI0004DF3EEC|nr:hypothetical protein [Methylomarinum vadi]